MAIRVDYLSPIAAVTGTRSEQLGLDQEITVKQLIEQLARRYGLEFQRFFWDDQGRWRPQAIVNLNGKLVRDFGELVSPDAIVLIAPPVVGG